MASKTYLISLDLLDPTLDLDGLKEFIKTSAVFENWWNHIPGVFLVVSDRDAAAISKAVRRYTNEARLLVIEINPHDSDGWLSERGWKWVRRRSRDAEQTGAQ
jgi:hypothetical protein